MANYTIYKANINDPKTVTKVLATNVETYASKITTADVAIICNDTNCDADPSALTWNILRRLRDWNKQLKATIIGASSNFRSVRYNTAGNYSQQSIVAASQTASAAIETTLGTREYAVIVPLVVDQNSSKVHTAITRIIDKMKNDRLRLGSVTVPP